MVRDDKDGAIGTGLTDRRWRMTVLVAVRPTEASGSQCLPLSCALVIQSQPNTAAGECSVTKLRLRSAVRTMLLLSNDCLSSFHIPNIRPLSPSTSPDFLSEKISGSKIFPAIPHAAL